MKRAVAFSLTIALLLLALSGCGGAPGAQETPAPSPAPTAPPEEPVEEEVDTTPPLVRVATCEPVDLDPASITPAGKSCLLEIYEPLFTTGERGGALLCVLADGSQGEFGGYDHAAGTAVYTVYVRGDVSDHDGNAFSASDAAFCYRRAAETLGWGVLSTAEATEDGQLRLTFTRELSGPGELQEYLCDIYMYTEQAWNEHNGLTAHACGTGPYVFDHFTPGTELVANAWEGYRQDAQPLPRSAANVKSIRYIFPESAAEGVIALETDRADMADCLDYADTVDFRGEGVYTDMFRLHETWSATNDILVPNLAWESLMDDQNLRKGVFYAIDNAWSTESFGEGGGRAVYAPGNSDYPDSFESWQAKESYQTQSLDVDSVRTYLRQATYVNEALTLLVTENSSAEQLGLQIQTMLRPWSITINLVAVDAETFETTLASQRDWDMAIVSVESQSSLAQVWNELWQSRYINYYYPGFLRDAAFQQKLQPLQKQSGCTEEAMTALLDYVIEKAYAMGLPQKCCPVVVPVDVTQVYTTARGELLPGACTYTS